MPQAFIALGSNIEPERNLELALTRLNERTRLLAISTVWQTAPVGRPEQDDYYNCVALIETDLPPEELKTRVLHPLEADLGRVRIADKYAPRTIDLDVILYDNLILPSGDLVLPEPDILTRPFLAAGLLELSPQLQIPGQTLSISQIAAALPRDRLKPLLTYTRFLRENITHEPR